MDRKPTVYFKKQHSGCWGGRLGVWFLPEWWWQWTLLGRLRERTKKCVGTPTSRSACEVPYLTGLLGLAILDFDETFGIFHWVNCTFSGTTARAPMSRPPPSSWVVVCTGMFEMDATATEVPFGCSSRSLGCPLLIWSGLFCGWRRRQAVQWQKSYI